MALLAAACRPDGPPAPDDLIPPETMVELLTQIHLTEAKIGVLSLPPDTAALYFQYQRQRLFAGHQVDSARFRRSYEHYLNHIDQIDDIYAAVVDSLGAIESRRVHGNPSPADQPDTTSDLEN